MRRTYFLQQKIPDLSYKIRDAKKIVTVGEKYKHYKGGLYYVVSLAINENTQEVDVIYHPIKGCGKNILFTRPVKQWSEEISNIDWNRFPQGFELRQKRFEKV